MFLSIVLTYIRVGRITTFAGGVIVLEALGLALFFCFLCFGYPHLRSTSPECKDRMWVALQYMFKRAYSLEYAALGFMVKGLLGRAIGDIIELLQVLYWSV